MLVAVAVLGDNALAHLRAQAQRAARAIDPKSARRMPAGIAATLIGALSADLSEDSRRAPLASVACAPGAIRRAAEYAWDALDDHERAALVRAAASGNDAASAGALLERLGAAGRASLPDERRAALLDAARAPNAAVGAALTDAERAPCANGRRNSRLIHWRIGLRGRRRRAAARGK